MVHRRALRAGLLYCLFVFVAGFALGVVRVKCVAPLSGELAAVVLEAPIMLAIAWHVCGWITERLDVSEALIDRLAMGGVALAALMLAEAVVGLAITGRIGSHLAEWGRSAMLLGLLAQLVFALFPILRRHRAAI